MIKDKWNFAKEYYPSIEIHYNKLFMLNKNLAWQFQILCVETKSFSNADNISKKLRNDWLIRYFGEKKDIQDIAVKAINAKRINIAKELNKAVKLLGDDAYKVIIQRIKTKHPDFFVIDEGSKGSTYKGYEFIEMRYLSGGSKWKIVHAPKQVSIGMEFEDEERLKHYIDYNESL